jgi:hypothetical protein
MVRITTVFDTVGSRGKSTHDQANDVVDVDGKCIKNAITYFSHVKAGMLIFHMQQAGQGLLYFSVLI